MTEPGDLFSDGFERAEEAAQEGGGLIVDVDGFEGPLHVLVDLARAQKVDLKRISVMALVDQYIEFIRDAKARRLTLAADYLVMAAWLAYLKSRLLLPRQDRPNDEPAPEELAERLAWRLQRLEAMRKAGEALWSRAQVGRDVFLRGAAEPVEQGGAVIYTADLWELVKAYAAQRVRNVRHSHVIKPPVVLALEDARRRLERLISARVEWSTLDMFDPDWAGGDGRPTRASCRASMFAASLELAREGKVELKQSYPFAPLYLRARSTEMAS